MAHICDTRNDQTALIRGFHGRLFEWPIARSSKKNDAFLRVLFGEGNFETIDTQYRLYNTLYSEHEFLECLSIVTSLYLLTPNDLESLQIPLHLHDTETTVDLEASATSETPADPMDQLILPTAGKKQKSYSKESRQSSSDSEPDDIPDATGIATIYAEPRWFFTFPQPKSTPIDPNTTSGPSHAIKQLTTQ